MTVRVTAEADTRQGPGHAIIRVEGAKVPPDGVRFLIRRPGYREDTLGPSGWQAAEAQLTPEAAYVAQGMLTLHVGPEVVAHMEPGMNVGFWLALPDGTMLDGRLAWPAIPGPIGGAGARRGRLVATQRVANDPAPFRTGGALVGDVKPQPRPAPPVVAATPPEPARAPEPVAAASAPPTEPVHEEPREETRTEAAAEEADAEAAAAPAERGRIDLRAERDREIAAAEASRRSPWGGRVALTSSIALLLLAGAVAASVYFGRDQICASELTGELADEWGLCPPVIVAEATPPEEPATETPPSDAPEEIDWEAINPLTWLGPLDTPAPEGTRPADDATRAAALEPQQNAGTGEPATPLPSPESQRALARQFLEGQPSPEDAFARANAFAEEGQVEAAFLIYRYAAERDLAAAAGAVAAMYDPETYTPETSPLPRPNATVARRWYERAVAAGDEAALLSLARMLVAQNEVEEARAVLHQAEEAGLGEEASQLLEELE